MAALDSQQGAIGTQREVADYLRISQRTLQRWHKAGKGPPRLSASRYSWTAVYAWRIGEGAGS
jgi:hypothetical protein